MTTSLWLLFVLVVIAAAMVALDTVRGRRAVRPSARPSIAAAVDRGRIAVAQVLDVDELLAFHRRTFGAATMLEVAERAPVRYMQGIAVPAESVRPAEFFHRTRRQIQPEGSKAYAGLGGSDTFEIKKAGILAGMLVKFSGALTVTPGTGTAAMTRRWPYDLMKRITFTANGQANIINASGLKLKAREYMGRDLSSDRGVSQSIGAATKTQGTLAQASESWGAGSGSTVAAPLAAVPVEFSIFIPVAEDQIELAGAIFAATSTTDLTLTIDWETLANLITLTGNATAALTGTVSVVSVKYSIPLGGDGEIVVPDLSVFHSLIQSRHTGLALAANELRIVGQGAGKTLLRAYHQVWNGAAPQVPLALDATNFGELAWRYAGNETPDQYPTGQHLRELNERMYDTDVGGVWGFGVHEFASENAFRDSVDMGTTSEFRLLVTIPSGVALNNAAAEIVTETIFSAGAGG